MTEFYNEGSTIVIIVGSVFAFLIMISRIVYKSKCKTISCCFNLLRIERNVEIETDIVDSNNNNNVV